MILPLGWTSVKTPPVRLAMSLIAFLAFGSMRATQLMTMPSLFASLPSRLATDSLSEPAEPSVMKKMTSGWGFMLRAISSGYSQTVPKTIGVSSMSLRLCLRLPSLDLIHSACCILDLIFGRYP